MATLRRRNHGSGHSYSLDGVKVPGPTSVVGATVPKQLEKWAAETTAAYAVDNWEDLSGVPPSRRLARLNSARFEDRDKAARRGTRVHKLAEALVVGDEVDVPDELAGHVESYTDFLNRVQPRPVAVELVVANVTEQYCGTVDLIADLPALTVDDEDIPAARWLLDLKTSRSGIFAETALQLCAYRNAELFEADPEPRPVEWLKIERCGAVHVRADGWDLYPVETGAEVWEWFRTLRWIYDRQEHGDRGTHRLPSHWIGPAAEPPRPGA